MTAPRFLYFIKKTQINPDFSNFSMYHGWHDFRDQSVVCQDISKVPCFVKNTTDISVLIGIFRNSVKVPCFVKLCLILTIGYLTISSIGKIVRFQPATP